MALIDPQLFWLLKVIPSHTVLWHHVQTDTGITITDILLAKFMLGMKMHSLSCL